MKPDCLVLWTERRGLVHAANACADSDGDVLWLCTFCGRVGPPEDAEPFEPGGITCRRCQRTKPGIWFL
jgi:hypothetical protein